MEKYYVRRNKEGKIIGSFMSIQHDTNEILSENHPDLLEFLESLKPRLKGTQIIKPSGPTEI